MRSPVDGRLLAHSGTSLEFRRLRDCGPPIGRRLLLFFWMLDLVLILSLGGVGDLRQRDAERDS